MPEGNKNSQDNKVKFRKQQARNFFKNLTIIVIVSVLFAVGFIWLKIPNVFIFFFLAFMPALSAMLWDKKPGRFASKTVAAFNITGMVPYLIAIGSSGSPDTTAYNSISDVYAWLLIYSFAGFGWGVVYLIPQITLVFLEIRSKYMIAKMKRFQQDLVEEWGEEVKK
jgi:hypothetical protein